jgi:hypothetical protein
MRSSQSQRAAEGRLDDAARSQASGRDARDLSARGGRSHDDPIRETRMRQREEFGGFSWGSVFFGWLVAVGLAALLLAIVSAAGAAVGLTSASEREVSRSAETIGIAGGVLLLVVLALAYYAGGYVAGRMARFNGPRQGVGVWLLGLAVTLLLAAAGTLLGAEYNVLERLGLPRIPVGEGSLTTGGLIALVAVVVVTLLAAIAGGKAGTRFHRKIDRVGPA